MKCCSGELNERTHGGLTAVNDLAREHRQPEFSIGDDLPLLFYCECSNPECTKRIRMSYREYGGAHRTKLNFIVVPGHENKAIERVVAKYRLYNVVRKNINLPEKPGK